MVEKRRSQRFSMSSFVSYKPGLFSGRLDAMTKNISLRGTCFFSEKKLAPNKIIMLRLHYGNQVGSRKIRARVVYSQPVEDTFGKGYFVGVEFLN